MLRSERWSGESLNAIDLFAGCGGLTSGLKAASINVVAAVEIDADAARSYRANHPEVVLFESDIRTISPADVLATTGVSQIELIAGCPPCQGFTRLTERSKRREARNSLVRDYFRFVAELRPQVCMLENVPGLLRTSKGLHYFDELRRGLTKLGYALTFEILELANYGVPQFRKRLVLVATKNAGYCLPKPTHGPSSQSRRPWATVRSAIEDLAVPPTRTQVEAGTALPRPAWHYARAIAPIVQQRLRHALDGTHNRAEFPTELRLKCHSRTPKGFNDVYGVMEWDSPSPTITGGCTNASKGRFGHPAQPRPITAAEAARLQTFPRGYRFEGRGVESVAAQIGNALPCRFAKVMGESILRHLATSNAD